MAYIPPNPNGNAVAAASAPMTLASDNNGPVKIYDGSNTSSVVVGDTGMNGLAGAAAVKTINFSTSATGAQILGPFDVRGYSSIYITNTASGTALAWNAQFSPTVGGQYITSTAWSNLSSANQGTSGGLTTNAGLISRGMVIGNYFQLNITGMTGGTTSGTITLSAAPSAPIAVQVVQQGTFTVTPVATNGYNGDSLAVSTAAQPVFALNGMVGGGTTVDRQRSVGALSDAAAATGIAAAGMVGYNGATWDRFRDNTTGAIIAAGATTAQTSATQISYNAKKLHVVINVSGYTSGSLTFTINAITASGYTYPLLASAAISAAGTTVLRIFTGATPSANAVSNDMVPRSFTVVVSGTFSATYGVDYQLSL